MAFANDRICLDLVPRSPVGGASLRRASGGLAEVRGTAHVGDDIYTISYNFNEYTIFFSWLSLNSQLMIMFDVLNFSSHNNYFLMAFFLK